MQSAASKRSDASRSARSESSLNSEDKRKLARLARRFKDTVEGKEDKKEMQKKINDEWVDSSPDLVEGIFSVN